MLQLLFRLKMIKMSLNIDYINNRIVINIAKIGTHFIKKLYNAKSF